MYNNVMTTDEQRKYNREKMRRWRETNREAYNAYMREYNKTHPLSPDKREAATQRGRKWVADNRTRAAETSRAHWRRNHDRLILEARQRMYGVTPAVQIAMLEAQAHVCAVCHQPERRVSQYGFVRALHLDHDHATGAVRAFLCGDCNRLLGVAKDDAAKLRAAADYLDQHAGVRDALGDVA